MRISNALTKNELLSISNEFYNYFETGYIFEDFLKEYFIKMGLDEVEVTQRSRDGGIDLRAIRKGVGDFSEIDTTLYHIQAKRYAPSKKIAVKDIRQLKGTIPFGAKGIFITTAMFSTDSETEATNDPSKPVVLIDGLKLITSCIDNEIGFIYKPIFSNDRMNTFFRAMPTSNIPQEHEEHPMLVDYVEKLITANDIRSGIVSIPSSIINKFPCDLGRIDVLVNDQDRFTFNIVRGRNYFGGVTSFLRQYGLLGQDRVITPKQSKWVYDTPPQQVRIYIES